MPRPYTCSPSQLELSARCLRRWSFSRHRPRPPQEGPALYGDKCHKIAENWGMHGAPPDQSTPEGRTILSVLHLIPKPGEAEHELEARAEMGGVKWFMRIDWIDHIVPGVLAQFGDLKTTGSFDWQKTPETLTTDPQAILYGTFVARRLEVPRVVGRWVYGIRAKRPPPGRQTVFTATRDELEARFEPLAARARGLEQIVSWDPFDLPRNLGDCHSFHRPCEFMGECYAGDPPSAKERLAAELVQIRS